MVIIERMKLNNSGETKGARVKGKRRVSGNCGPCQWTAKQDHNLILDKGAPNIGIISLLSRVSAVTPQ